ncbi:MAG: DUF1259 domain-containing protein [Gemmatimonadaceae bacterium]|nr:DUF1259 domain-containing protein [Gemmatimonadaceae bacterium]NUO94619.1 DUF1259 domain-containing protein [Gemmatimonadaceae bacterium]NUP55908.1 DUF1259 domain-containing protein [Gemmatimonadaceae bacterium]NUR36347.1 DUF1259 domain-containing protein [Gemmatimonadaceae bacterium]NUS33498.1 DUF1259 domain-containing protein [Gemmatimonadaceae bacterium]
MQTDQRVARLSRLAAGATLATALVSGLAAGQQTSSKSSDWSAVDQALGRKGAAQPGDVMKYSFPRSDLQVTVNGVQVKPGFALGSWIAFKRTTASAMMMGDLVLAEDEVAPVMRVLQQGGVEQTALHNHVLGETPRVMYMHVMGHGDPAKLAQAVRTALGESRTPIEAPAAPAAAAPTIDLDTAVVARALGTSGKVNGGVYQVSIPRRERVTDHGMEVPPSMGVATAINFQPTGGGKAAITGDFVMIASEVNPVIRALEQHGITPTALHSHMLTESPRLFFMHFWANDDAATLAKGLRAALDQMAVKTSAKRATR